MISIPKILSNPHPIVAAWISQDKREAMTYVQWGSTEERIATAELNKRKYLITSSLLKACEKRGLSVTGNNDNRKICWVNFGEDKIGFIAEEWIKQTRRLLKKEERPAYNPNQKWGVDQEKTGLLLIRYLCSASGNTLLTVRESLERPIEQMLNDVMIELAKELLKEKKRRLYAEKKEATQKLEEEKRLNRKRKELLEEAALNWRKSTDIRAYIAAVEEAYKGEKLNITSEAYSTWLEWATHHADELDPIIGKQVGKELTYTEK